jgi:CheY-like chemotaxis protein
MLRCLIVDDNPHFQDAARDLLEREGVAAVGAASTNAETARRVDELQPDVALVDIDVGDESGLDVARRLYGTGRQRASRKVSTASAGGTCRRDGAIDVGTA